MRRRRVAVIAVAVAVLGVLAAVLAIAGDGATTAGTDVAAPAIAPGRPSGVGDAGSGATGSAGGAAPGSAGLDVASPPAPSPAVPGAPDAAPAPEAKTDGAATAPLPDAVGRDVVRTAQLTLQVPDPVAAARGVRTAATAAGGFVAEEQADATGSWLVVRVPAAALDRLVDDLAATGTVVARSARAEDATDQVVDLDGRVATQQASVTRVRALLAQATSIGDIVAVEAELARREADLDSLQRRLAALRDRVALSTLTVELRGAVATPPSAPPPGFGAGLGAGWAGLKIVGAALATAVGFLLPFLPILAVAAVAVWIVVRRRRRRGGPGPEGGV
jgi:Domain of unknown function (DUF4349)